MSVSFWILTFDRPWEERALMVRFVIWDTLKGWWVQNPVGHVTSSQYSQICSFVNPKWLPVFIVVFFFFLNQKMFLGLINKYIFSIIIQLIITWRISVSWRINLPDMVYKTRFIVCNFSVHTVAKLELWEIVVESKIARFDNILKFSNLLFLRYFILSYTIWAKTSPKPVTIVPSQRCYFWIWPLVIVRSVGANKWCHPVNTGIKASDQMTLNVSWTIDVFCY